MQQGDKEYLKQNDEDVASSGASLVGGFVKHF